MAENTSNSSASIVLAILVSASAIGLAAYMLAALPKDTVSDSDGPTSADVRPDTGAEPKLGQQASDSEREPAEGGPTEFVATVMPPIYPAQATREQFEIEVESVCSRLLERMPNEPRALHVQAIYNAQLHRTEQAEKLWRKCIELDPKTEQYYVNLASCLIDKGESEAALEQLNAAVKVGLSSPDISYHRGLALLNTGQLEEAVEVSKQALEQVPQSPSHWLILGQANLQLGNAKDAEDELRKAIEFGAENRTAYFALFNASMLNGNIEAAKEIREQHLSAAESEPVVQSPDTQTSRAPSAATTRAPSGTSAPGVDDVVGRNLVIYILSESALLYQAAGDNQNAEYLLLRILSLSPNSVAVAQQLADFYAQTNQLANERVLRRRVVELDGSLMNKLMLAKTESQCGDEEAATAMIRSAIADNPLSVAGYATMAEFQMELGAPDKAESYIRRALELEPSITGQRMLASVLRAQGKEQEAQQAEAEAKKIEEN